jgi:hypothetical protein
MKAVFVSRIAIQLLVDFLSDMRILLQCHEVFEIAAVGHVEFHLSLTGLVGELLHEEIISNIVLVLTGIHGAAQGIARLPKGAVYVVIS